MNVLHVERLSAASRKNTVLMMYRSLFNKDITSIVGPDGAGK